MKKLITLILIFTTFVVNSQNMWLPEGLVYKNHGNYIEIDMNAEANQCFAYIGVDTINNVVYNSRVHSQNGDGGTIILRCVCPMNSEFVMNDNEFCGQPEVLISPGGTIVATFCEGYCEEGDCMTRVTVMLGDVVITPNVHSGGFYNLEEVDGIILNDTVIKNPPMVHDIMMEDPEVNTNVSNFVLGLMGGSEPTITTNDNGELVVEDGYTFYNFEMYDRVMTAVGDEDLVHNRQVSQNGGGTPYTINSIDCKCSDLGANEQGCVLYTIPYSDGYSLHRCLYIDPIRPCSRGCHIYMKYEGNYEKTDININYSVTR